MNVIIQQENREYLYRHLIDLHGTFKILWHVCKQLQSIVGLAQSVSFQTVIQLINAWFESFLQSTSTYLMIIQWKKIILVLTAYLNYLIKKFVGLHDFDIYKVLPFVLTLYIAFPRLSSNSWANSIVANPEIANDKNNKNSIAYSFCRILSKPLRYL